MRYAERKYTQRCAFLRELRHKVAAKSSKNIIYLDESGFDQSQNYRDSAWGFRGQKIYGERSGKRWHRTSLLMAQRAGEWLSPMLFGGTCNTVTFNTWLEEVLLPDLKKTPDQTIVMDNASIHKSEKTRKLIESAGHEVLFLPPYSPDFNPIENSFATLKKRLKYAPAGTTLDELLLCKC